MKKVIALVLALALVFALCACGSPKAKYTVGICQLVQHEALDAATQGFKDALTEKFGKDVAFDEQNAQGDSATCSTIITGFVSNKVNLIMANATPALQAAVSATDSIPVLGTSVTDFGTALSIEIGEEGTGINVSGTSDGVPGILYAQLTKQIVPNVKNISILYCSAEANSVIQAEDFKAACAEIDPSIVCTEFTFTDSNDIQAVVTSAIEGCDALYIPTDNAAASNMTIISNVCQPAKVPVICGEENMCKNGGLATVSISYYNIGYVCGQMACEILANGGDVSKMPIGYADNPVLEYNKAFAEAIGFDFDFEGAGFTALS